MSLASATSVSPRSASGGRSSRCAVGTRALLAGIVPAATLFTGLLTAVATAAGSTAVPEILGGIGPFTADIAFPWETALPWEAGLAGCWPGCSAG